MPCNILVRTLQYLKNNFLPWKHKKLTSKVAYLWQFGFFFSAALTAHNSPELDTYPFYRFLYPMISGTIPRPKSDNQNCKSTTFIHKKHVLFFVNGIKVFHRCYVSKTWIFSKSLHYFCGGFEGVLRFRTNIAN